MTVLLIRHAESVGNVAARQMREENDDTLMRELASTHTSTWPLSERGEKQAEVLGQYLNKHKVFRNRRECHLCSTYERAVQTASRIPLSRYTWNLLPGLAEQDWGQLTALNIEEKKMSQHHFASRKREGRYWRPPGGESTLDVIKRMPEIFDDKITGDYYPIVLAVTHGEFMIAAQSMLLSISDKEFIEGRGYRGHPGNCEIIEVTKTHLNYYTPFAEDGISLNPSERPFTSIARSRSLS